MTALIPDLDHYHGRGGRVFPLWLDDRATTANLRPGVLRVLSDALDREVSAEDLFAYVVAVVANPSFTVRFSSDMSMPGIRVPLTAEPDVFEQAVDLGRQVVWLHTFGERFVDVSAGRPPSPPRLPPARSPRVPADGAIPTASGRMPDTLGYDSANRRLLVGAGWVENVTPEMWSYQVSGMRVLQQWFSYRRASRQRPLIGDKRPPSRLEKLMPDHWLAEYTTDLLDILNVLGLLVDLEPLQAALLNALCTGQTLTLLDLAAQGALDVPDGYPTKPFRGPDPSASQLFV